MWIDEHGLDVFGIKEFFQCSYTTALIRLNLALCRSEKQIPLICILYERPYWNKTPSGRTQRLKFKHFTKSQGFTFQLSKHEIKEICFHTQKNPSLSVPQLIKKFYHSSGNLLVKKIKLTFKDVTLTVDVLVQTVNWNNHKHTSKVLIQIIPSEFSNLRSLADRLKIKQYEG